MLSIIIPCLNEEKYLPILLEQIKKQSFTDYEIIVADAGSKDKTREIAKNYNCRIVQGGLPAKSRNEGAKIAQGDIFLFMDADNIFLPQNFFATLLAGFKKRNLDIASFPICPDCNGFDKFAYGIYNFWAKLTQKFIAHATNSILVKKTIHQKINGFDEDITIAEDHYYARQGAKIAKFGFISTESVLTSCRRFIRDGRLKTYLIYLLAAIHMFFVGKITSDIYDYRFDGSLRNNKK